MAAPRPSAASLTVRDVSGEARDPSGKWTDGAGVSRRVGLPPAGVSPLAHYAVPASRAARYAPSRVFAPRPQQALLGSDRQRDWAYRISGAQRRVLDTHVAHRIAQQPDAPARDAVAGAFERAYVRLLDDRRHASDWIDARDGNPLEALHARLTDPDRAVLWAHGEALASPPREAPARGLVTTPVTTPDMTADTSGSTTAGALPVAPAVAPAARRVSTPAQLAARAANRKVPAEAIAAVLDLKPVEIPVDPSRWTSASNPDTNGWIRNWRITDDGARERRIWHPPTSAGMMRIPGNWAWIPVDSEEPGGGLSDQYRNWSDAELHGRTQGRVNALGHQEACHRCLGTGRFSHNGQHDLCYRCGGDGKEEMHPTQRLLDAVTEDVASGRAGRYHRMLRERDTVETAVNAYVHAGMGVVSSRLAIAASPLLAWGGVPSIPVQTWVVPTTARDEWMAHHFGAVATSLLDDKRNPSDILNDWKRFTAEFFKAQASAGGLVTTSLEEKEAIHARMLAHFASEDVTSRAADRKRELGHLSLMLDAYLIDEHDRGCGPVAPEHALDFPPSSRWRDCPEDATVMFYGRNGRASSGVLCWMAQSGALAHAVYRMRVPAFDRDAADAFLAGHRAATADDDRGASGTDTGGAR